MVELLLLLLLHPPGHPVRMMRKAGLWPWAFRAHWNTPREPRTTMVELPDG
jgi:hypothetical protein